jgi:hypothetical protein
LLSACNTTPDRTASSRCDTDRRSRSPSTGPHLGENERQAGVVVAANDGNAATEGAHMEQYQRAQQEETQRQRNTKSWLTGCEAAPAAGSAA